MLAKAVQEIRRGLDKAVGKLDKQVGKGLRREDGKNE